MDNRFEAFSLGRDISYKKFTSSIGKKARWLLSSIMRHDQKITDEEIYLCRNALEKRDSRDLEIKAQTAQRESLIDVSSSLTETYLH